MKKHGKYIILFTLIFVVGCANKEIADYKDDDIAIIVRGEEITVGELRILYTDEKVLDMIESTIKTKLVIQEAEQMNIEVADEIEQEIEATMKGLLEDSEEGSWRSIRDFAAIQSERLNLTHEQFYEKYLELIIVQNVYMNAYFTALLGEPGEQIEDIQEYNSKVNVLLNELLEKHAREIEIIIK